MERCPTRTTRTCAATTRHTVQALAYTGRHAQAWLSAVECRRHAVPLPSRRPRMSGGSYPDGTTHARWRVTSRRSLLKGLTAVMAVGAIAPLAAACGQQAAPAK